MEFFFSVPSIRNMLRLLLFVMEKHLGMRREKSRCSFKFQNSQWFCSFLSVLSVFFFFDFWLQGHLDVELNDAGRQQAERVYMFTAF